MKQSIYERFLDVTEKIAAFLLALAIWMIAIFLVVCGIILLIKLL